LGRVRVPQARRCEDDETRPFLPFPADLPAASNATSPLPLLLSGPGSISLAQALGGRAGMGGGGSAGTGAARVWTRPIHGGRVVARVLLGGEVESSRPSE
jgi:hypothetical protein